MPPMSSKPLQGQVSARGTTYLSGMEGPVMLAYGATEARITGFLRSIQNSFASTLTRPAAIIEE